MDCIENEALSIWVSGYLGGNACLHIESSPCRGSGLQNGMRIETGHCILSSAIVYY